MLFDSLSITVIAVLIIQYTNSTDVCLDESDGALLPNPDNCSTFFHCFNGVGYLGTCPSNLYFNPETESCDRKENVECDAEEKDENINCPPDDDPNYLIYYPSKIRCEWYYLCAKGTAHKLECAPGFHWHQENFQCDKPEIAKCKIAQSTTDSPISFSTSTSTNTSRTHSSPKTKTTTSRSTRKPTSSYTESTTSIFTTISTISPDLTTDANGVACPSNGLHTYPHPTRCDMFIFCRDGHSSLQRCPGFYNFDSIQHVCLFRNYAKCLPSSEH